MFISHFDAFIGNLWCQQSWEWRKRHSIHRVCIVVCPALYFQLLLDQWRGCMRLRWRKEIPKQTSTPRDPKLYCCCQDLLCFHIHQVLLLLLLIHTVRQTGLASSCVTCDLCPLHRCSLLPLTAALPSAKACTAAPSVMQSGSYVWQRRPPGAMNMSWSCRVAQQRPCYGTAESCCLTM